MIEPLNKLPSDVLDAFKRATSPKPGAIRVASDSSEVQRPPIIGHGPGTELSKLLGMVGIHPIEEITEDVSGVKVSMGCGCNQHAEQMDRWGPDECERRIDEIIGWLKVEAKYRSLPFATWIARTVVQAAIRRARQRASNG